jgi:ABC-2 type transport system ATP-binding protein
MIHVHELRKRYRNATRNALDGISFDVGAGEFFALLGPNGAGKTTTISILTTTIAPTAGTATIDGHDIVAEASTVRSLAGIIFQRPSLDVNLTGEENVRFHAVLYGQYGYAPFYRLMDHRYRRQLDELVGVLGIGREIFAPVRTYSGGTRRKLEIVRSLMHRPKVLFLDEPTAGLDVPTRRALWDYLATVRRDAGTTIVLTTHYLEEAEQTDRICVVNDGRIVVNATPTELKAELVEEFVVVDADDRPALVRELATRGFAHSGDGPVRIELDGRSVHAMLRAIETPLSSVQTHTPSLEDAYLEIVRRADEQEEAS